MFTLIVTLSAVTPWRKPLRLMLGCTVFSYPFSALTNTSSVTSSTTVIGCSDTAVDIAKTLSDTYGLLRLNDDHFASFFVSLTTQPHTSPLLQWSSKNDCCNFLQCSLESTFVSHVDLVCFSVLLMIQTKFPSHSSTSALV